MSYAWCLEILSVVLVDFKGILNKDGLEVGRDFGLLDHEVEVEGFAQELLGLELDLVVHLFTEIDLSGLIGGDKVNH